MPTLTPEIVPGLLSTGASSRASVTVPAKFKVGETIRTQNINPVTHTRLPRYVRGKTGVIQRAHGTFHFNDAVAHGREEVQNVYSVRFSFRELWGEAYDPHTYLHIDLFESYMDKV